MGYGSYMDVANELGERELMRITNLDGESPVQLKVQIAIDFADILIDTYIRGRYILPLSGPSPGILRKISKDLAINYLYEGAYAKSAMPNTIVWKKIDAMKLLLGIQSGDIILQNQERMPSFVITNSKQNVNK